MTQKSANQRRIDNLTKWAKDSAFIPGMKQQTYVKIFEYVLGKQDKKTGSWNFPGEKWQVVMTAVVLKALSSLAFELSDSWELAGGGAGGVHLAAQFVGGEVAKKEGDPKVGDDIWDGCQAALALSKFGISEQAQAMVTSINDNWHAHWSFALNDAHKNRWCGAAYLAAMVDVLRQYEKSLDGSKLVDAFTELAKLETEERNTPLGFFRASAKAPRGEMDLWNTVLALRTLCAAASEKSDAKAIEQIRRVTLWVLEQLDSDVWKQNLGERPMFLARSLHGLCVALPMIDDVPTRLRIREWLKRGNRLIEDMFSREDEHNLKSYTAVIEYLADWTVEAPAGLIFHASQILTSSSVESIAPLPRDGGLRIAWLSDLHVAQIGDPEPSYFSPLRRWAGNWMWFKGTDLSAEFQQMNVKTILERVNELDFDHILVTGDVTNYARRNQFDSVKTDFLTMQMALTVRRNAKPLGNPELDPKLWTILPGNHDVTNDEVGSGYEKANLGMFFNAFASTYDKDFRNRNYDTAFPLVKEISGRDAALRVKIIGLDSNVRYPVWKVGVNARGKIDSEQMALLKRELAKPNPPALTLVALHHHPIVVVELGSKLEDYFLSLKESHGRELIKLCAHMNVGAILHGHFHAFSSWSGLTPRNRQMAIIGSSAGTLTVPGTHEEFLELREADFVAHGDEQHGLALYAHQLVNGKWVEKYTDIFLPRIPGRQ